MLYHKSWKDHFLEGRKSADPDAGLIIRITETFEYSRVLSELPAHLSDHSEGGFPYRLHGEC